MGRYAHAAPMVRVDDDRRYAREAMGRCGCLEFAGRPLATLSGGERQRVFLAACLAQQARLVLLDEPATYLDVDQQLRASACCARRPTAASRASPSRTISTWP